MLRAGWALMRGLFGRCPACGRGQIFNSFYGLNERCSYCKNRFHQDGSPTVGAMIINMFVTILLGFIGGIGLVLVVDVDSLMLALLALLVALGIFSSIFYRFARGLWVGITTLTGANEEG